MGASGAGKSTLLDVVAGRKVGGICRGSVRFGGHERDEFFTRMSAYVMQDDIHIPCLTVKETLGFAARLRMGKEYTEVERESRIGMVIEWLNLGNCEDTIVGDEFQRGISGGQRKRLSIGVEIIGLPEVRVVSPAAACASRVLRCCCCVPPPRLGRDGFPFAAMMSLNISMSCLSDPLPR